MVTLAGIVVEGHAVAAGVLCLVDVGYYELAGVEVEVEVLGEVFLFRVVGQDGAAVAVKAQDVGRAIVCAEHEGDAAVLKEVGRCFIAAAVKVEVGDLCGG